MNTLMKIKNVYYGVSDVQGSSEFYQKTLGLELQFIDGNQWAQFNVNGETFALGGPEEVPSAVKTGAVVTFEVESLMLVRKRLKEKNIEVSETRDMGSHGKTCWFLDPSDNVIQLYEKPTV